MDWLRDAAGRRPGAPALITDSGMIDYAHLDRAADSVAGALAGSGVVPGDRVAFWGSVTPRTVAAVWGVPRAGAIGVPILPWLRAEDARSLTRRAGVSVLWDRVDDPDIVVPGRAGPPTGAWGPPVASARYAVFTSGSEGPPKGVVITGAQIAASAAASQRRLGNGPDDPWLCPLPLAHVGGLSVLWRSARVGAPVRLLEHFTSASAAEGLRECRYASLVPTMLRRIVDRGDRFEGLAAVLVGGGPAPPSLLEAAIERGIPALQTYGSTETASQAATVAPDEVRRRVGTAGRPLDGVELRIVDEAGRPVAPGHPGRIEVRGPIVSPGYLDEPEREPGSWLRMNDLGSIDEAGYLTVLGRADRVVVTGGENVDPAEIEEVLRGCRDVVDARVHGEPDDEWGTVLVAEVVLDRGHLGEVQDCAAARLPALKVPKRWRVVGPSELGWKA